MNETPRREGFVIADDKPPEKRPESPTGKKAAPPPELEASPAELPPLEQDLWPIKIRLLYKKIKGMGGALTDEIELREPRAGDINRYGNPVRINQDGDVVIDERKMTYMISALTGMLPPLIEEMDPRDWNSCAYRLRRFFLPDPAAW